MQAKIFIQEKWGSEEHSEVNRYFATGNFCDLNFEQESWSSEDDPNDMVNLAGNILGNCYQSLDQHKLAKAITLYRESVSLERASDTDLWRCLSELSDALLLSYRLTNDMAQVVEAISCLEQVQKMQPSRLVCLGAASITGRISSPQTLKADDAIVNAQHILRAISIMDCLENMENEAALHLPELNSTLAMIHGNSSDMDAMNLDMVVTKFQKVQFLLPWGHSFQAQLLQSLRVLLERRYHDQHDPKDLDQAIGYLREALVLALHTPDHITVLENLVTLTTICSLHRECSSDLNERIFLH
jgi:tetratricopeptide (TPR) repeat protein